MYLNNASTAYLMYHILVLLQLLQGSWPILQTILLVSVANGVHFLLYHYFTVQLWQLQFTTSIHPCKRRSFHSKTNTQLRSSWGAPGLRTPLSYNFSLSWSIKASILSYSQNNPNLPNATCSAIHQADFLWLVERECLIIHYVDRIVLLLLNVLLNTHQVVMDGASGYFPPCFFLSLWRSCTITGTALCDHLWVAHCLESFAGSSPFPLLKETHALLSTGSGVLWIESLRHNSSNRYCLQQSWFTC